MSPVPFGRDHLAALTVPLAALEGDLARIESWAGRLAHCLVGGGRLLAAGNGGSAAQAQHLTSELVGRYRDDRRPFSAIALHAESSSFTAISNDYGAEEAFARQVRAHGRPGDVLLVLSTSGRSPNVLAAASAARATGLITWALTGPAPNPLAELCDEAVCVQAATATVQEVHQVVVHLLCAAFEHAVADTPAVVAASHPTRPRVRAGRSRKGKAGGFGAGSRRDRDRPLVVVGDALLDCDLDGTVERLCPDAPVPVVDDPVRTARPGGAALAAALAAAGGRPVVLVTALAGDEAGRELAGLLSAAGVAVADVGLSGATPEKVRVRAAGRSLLRLDHGGPPGQVGPLSAEAARALEGAAAVLVSDYGRGMTSQPALRSLLPGLRVPVVWDPHPRGTEPTPGARLATPNRSEAAVFAPEVMAGESLGAVAARARQLGRRWQAAGVAVTLGPGGAVYVEGDGLPLVVPAPPVTGGDPCGAGDRFAAAAALLLADGALPSEAVAGAVTEASAFVAAGGSAGALGPLQVDLRAEQVGEVAAAGAEAGGAGDGALAAAQAVIRAVRRRGGTVVATGGCFDLLHAGHVATLAAARALGDCLIVCLNSDASVRRLKGPGRPLVSEADRAAVLAALGAVDAVVVFDEDTPAAVLDRLRPDIFAKGGDYSLDALPEAAVLARWGGQAVVLPYVEGRSTTRIMEEAVRRGSGIPL